MKEAMNREDMVELYKVMNGREKVYHVLLLLHETKIRGHPKKLKDNTCKPNKRIYFLPSI